MEPKPLRPLPTQFLSKDKLTVGAYYIGFCRNANVTRWDGKQFWYWRRKFNLVFLEPISHPDDEPYFDVFQAVAEVKPEEVKDIPIGNEATQAV